ncbi:MULTISPECIES: DUF262 domain-containing protein [unclassified Microcoleus]|uniref:DUF262 domain-containing protein n=1 Tax=unclassified Microcoleus TaxID=2642155 RepID=UPI002FD00E5E
MSDRGQTITTQEQETIKEENLIENSLEEESDEKIIFRYSITSYGADYTLDSLVRRIQDGSIYVPSFQRAYVWKINDASRFIESLLLGLPVPGIFLSKEQDTHKLLVIDGLQRLRTLQYFYEGIFDPTKREFALKNVQSKFEGATYKSLPSEYRRSLDDSILHATIVKQDEPSDDNSSIYHIFERLNTGGKILTSQEIRACIYHGEFKDLLKELNENNSWRDIFGKSDSRMRDEELILRFLALYFNGDNYHKPMKEFLNQFMGKNQRLKLYSSPQIKQTFEPTIEVIHQSLGERAFKPNKLINAAVFDAVMIGIARRLEQGKIDNSETLKDLYQKLLNDEKFRRLTVDTARTTEEDAVNSRIEIATKVFAAL